MKLNVMFFTEPFYIEPIFFFIGVVMCFRIYISADLTGLFNKSTITYGIFDKIYRFAMIWIFCAPFKHSLFTYFIPNFTFYPFSIGLLPFFAFSIQRTFQVIAKFASRKKYIKPSINIELIGGLKKIAFSAYFFIFHRWSVDHFEFKVKQIILEGV